MVGSFMVWIAILFLLLFPARYQEQASSYRNKARCRL